MASDVERIRRDVSLSQTAAQFGVSLQRDGDEWVACCPFHSEDTPSFTIFRGKDHIERMHCFGCGAKGDVLDFVQAIKGVDIKEAIRILGGGKTDRQNVAPRHVEVHDPYAGLTPLNPPREIEPGQRVRLFNPKRSGTEREWGAFVPSLIHPYRRADGSLIGYVLRHDLKDGKETPMVMWVRGRNGDEAWCRFPFPKPRPLYRLETIGDARQVVLVEGEKCADALSAATGRVVISWAGGTQGVKHADWSPLRGRNVVMWPDADAPGVAAADEIGSILTAIECTYRVLSVPRAA